MCWHKSLRIVLTHFCAWLQTCKFNARKCTDARTFNRCVFWTLLNICTVNEIWRRICSRCRVRVFNAKAVGYGKLLTDTMCFKRIMLRQRYNFYDFEIKLKYSSENFCSTSARLLNINKLAQNQQAWLSSASLHKTNKFLDIIKFLTYLQDCRGKASLHKITELAQNQQAPSRPASSPKTSKHLFEIVRLAHWDASSMVFADSNEKFCFDEPKLKLNAQHHLHALKST